ncbi:MAG: DegT/DnrJ/EryC1/StrS family aminotransferase [Elusimicrobiota bacterium]
MKRIGLSLPIISNDEKKAVQKVLNSGFLASGSDVAELEEAFARYIGTRYAIAVSSGTTALHAALLANGIGHGDKVITTPFSFIATSNSVLFCGAKPIFCDIDENTFNLDPEKVEACLKKTKGVKAIIIVHLYGLSCDIDKFRRIAKKYNVLLIEDCAQSVGAAYKSKLTGSFGDAGCFSFYATKNMMTGEGGIITTNSKKVNDLCRSLINHGRSARFEHNILGFNFRMTNIAAALGNVQLKKIDSFNNARIKNAAEYDKILSAIPWIITPAVPKGYKHVYHQYTIKVPKSRRDGLIKYLNEKGIDAAPIYPICIPEQPLYIKKGYKALKIAHGMSKSVVCLPAHPKVTLKDVRYICECIKTFK